MDERNFNTESVAGMFVSILNFVGVLLVLIIFAFGYLLLEDHIQEYINRPDYTDKELQEFAKKRRIRKRQERSENWDLVEHGIHIKTGLMADPNLQVIIGACTSCHSAKLITQNRATKEGWENMIDWMQETQGLTDLGDKEPVIVDYLTKYYSPKEEGRRGNLDVESIDWYILDLK